MMQMEPFANFRICSVTPSSNRNSNFADELTASVVRGVLSLLEAVGELDEALGHLGQDVRRDDPGRDVSSGGVVVGRSEARRRRWRRHSASSSGSSAQGLVLSARTVGDTVALPIQRESQAGRTRTDEGRPGKVALPWLWLGR